MGPCATSIAAQLSKTVLRSMKCSGLLLRQPGNSDSGKTGGDAGATKTLGGSMKKLVVLASLFLATVFSAAQTSLPTGTAVKMKLDTTLATFSSKDGDPFSARVTGS